MKIIVLLIFIAVFQVNAKSLAQKVSLSENNASIQKVFSTIKKQTGYNFLYDGNIIKVANPVNIHVKNVELIDALDLFFNHQPFTYEILNNTIVVKMKPKASTFFKEIRENKLEDQQQQQQITGKIVDKDGNPIQGASVSLKGTRQGASTDNSGSFSITVPSNAILVISYLGFIAQEVEVSGQSTIQIVLEEDLQSLSDVVVTALGIEKDRKALGYSVTEVKGNELTQAREINVANSLVGKVAGVSVNSIAGGSGASTNVIIRGISSLGGSNQPLYVIDGVPMNNNVYSTPGMYGGTDSGDGISNINPDDIESISVLKGGAASALYGSRAKAGVILITTKNGSGNGGVEFNTNYVIENVMNPYDWQFEYGQGSNGLKPTTHQAALANFSSGWGEKLDGSMVIQLDGVERPYIAQTNNIKNFYKPGGTFTNTLSFSKGFEDGAVRVSASDVHNTSIMPNSGLNKQSFTLSSNYSPLRNLIIDVKGNYMTDKTKNRPRLSDSPGNANFGMMVFPTSLNIKDLTSTNADRNELPFTSHIYITNPVFSAWEYINDTNRERLIGVASIRYSFDKDFYVQARTGRDSYTDRTTSVTPNGTASRPEGSMSETFRRFHETNTDILVGNSLRMGNDLILTSNFGANLMVQKIETSGVSGNNFATPFLYSIGNTKTRSTSYSDSNQEIQSLYGTLEFDFRNTLYLNITGRNDWFSTLAPTTNKLDVFYPSINTSFVFSELFKSEWLNFGKLRAGYSQVGGSANPYQTLLYYGIGSSSINGFPIGNIINSSIPNNELMPSLAKELEIGTEFRIFNNRLNLDFTWYNKLSTNEILNAPASYTSGFSSVILNIGKLQNRGFEMLINGSVLRKENFTFSSSFNMSINHNKIIELANGQSALKIGDSRSENAYIQHIVGLPANQIMAFEYKKDASGNIQVDDNGVPLRGALTPHGSGFHKVTGGWNNEFTFKNFNLSFLIDGKFGGKIFSATDFNGYQYGLHKETLKGRDETYGKNEANSHVYYFNLAKNISSIFVQDASFIKFRQVTFGYNFNKGLFNNLIKSSSVNLVARNLFTIMKRTDNIDPESNYNGTHQGLELGGVPPIRTYGLNLNLKF